MDEKTLNGNSLDVYLMEFKGKKVSYSTIVLNWKT